MSVLPENRPLSPHLQVYRWRISMAVSIMHRVSGVVLSVGTAFLVIWLLAAATNAALMQPIQSLFGSWIGKIALLGWTVAFYVHLLNGIRHLCWDAGIGFDQKVYTISGWAVAVGVVVLTTLTWFAALAGGGA